MLRARLLIICLMPKDKNAWNAKHHNMNDLENLFISLDATSDEKESGRFAYAHFNRLTSYNTWMFLDRHKICDCKNKCTNDKHQFSIPLTQSSFRMMNKSTAVIYSKRYSKFVIVGRDKGLLCYKNVNYNWCDYYDNIDFNINGKQSYYKGDKAEKSIKKHYFLLIVNGFLRNCKYHYGVDVPIDLYGIVLKYYYQLGNDEWIFVQNVEFL